MQISKSDKENEILSMINEIVIIEKEMSVKRDDLEARLEILKNEEQFLKEYMSKETPNRNIGL